MDLARGRRHRDGLQNVGARIGNGNDSRLGELSQLLFECPDACAQSPHLVHRLRCTYQLIGWARLASR